MTVKPMDFWGYAYFPKTLFFKERLCSQPRSRDQWSSRCDDLSPDRDIFCGQIGFVHSNHLELFDYMHIWYIWYDHLLHSNPMHIDDLLKRQLENQCSSIELIHESFDFTIVLLFLAQLNVCPCFSFNLVTLNDLASFFDAQLRCMDVKAHEHDSLQCRPRTAILVAHFCQGLSCSGNNTIWVCLQMAVLIMRIVINPINIWICGVAYWQSHLSYSCKNISNVLQWYSQVCSHWYGMVNSFSCVPTPEWGREPQMTPCWQQWGVPYLLVIYGKSLEILHDFSLPRWCSPLLVQSRHHIGHGEGCTWRPSTWHWKAVRWEYHHGNLWM